MSGIAGIAQSGRKRDVDRMLDRIRHRGPAGRQVLDLEGGTLGVVWTEAQAGLSPVPGDSAVRDYAGDGHLAEAKITSGRIHLMRD
jgi:hypothetical protein